MRSVIKFLIFISLTICLACGSPNEQEKKPLNENMETSISASIVEEIVKETKGELSPIRPYKSPSSLEELFSQKYVLDTVYRENYKIGSGDGSMVQFFNFNKIIGIDGSKEIEKNIIFAIKPTSFYQPQYQEDNIYYLPFNIDLEGDVSIITKWIEQADKFVFDSYYGNLFAHKYGRMKVIDIMNRKKVKYFLMETYQAREEAGFDRKLYLAKEKSDTKLEMISKHDLKRVTQEDNDACCIMKYKNGKIHIVNENLNHLAKNELLQTVDLK